MRGRTLTRGGRVYGTVSCTALAVISLGWILRDLHHAAHSSDVWWVWSGLPARSSDGLWTTSSYEPLLLGVYLLVACTIPRSPNAAGTLGATGALTLVLRLPSLVNLRSDWLQGVDEALRTRAVLSAATAVVLSATMVLVSAVAPRPTVDGGGPVAPPESVAPVVGLLLSALGVVAVREVRLAQQLGWTSYQQRLTGEHSLLTLLSPPPAGAVWGVTLLALVASLATGWRLCFARPLAMMVAGVLLTWGLTAVTGTVRVGVWRHLGTLSVEGWLNALSELVLVVAGLVVLLVYAHGGLHSAPPRPVPGPGDGAAVPRSAADS